MKNKIYRLLVIALLSLTALSGCSNQSPVPAEANTPPPSSPQPTAATQTNLATIYMIKYEDNGKTANSVKVGCGDSAIPVEVTTGISYDATDPKAGVNAAIMSLFNTTEKQFTSKKLENPLAVGSALTIESTIDQNANAYVIHLDGKFQFTGTCDVPRQRAQVEETIRKALPKGSTFTIDWNGGGQAAWAKNFSSK